jgi:DNA-binding transcriptional ArsR family regulator
VTQRDVGATFSALADPSRRRMLGLLGDRGGATATELARELPISRQAVAKHLAALEAAGLVATRRQGRELRYMVTPQPLEDAVAWIAQAGAEWDERLARLQAYVEVDRSAQP